MGTYLSQEKLTLNGVREHMKPTLDRFLPGSWKRGSVQQKIPFKKQTLIPFRGKMVVAFSKIIPVWSSSQLLSAQNLYRKCLSCGLCSVTVCGAI